MQHGTIKSLLLHGTIKSQFSLAISKTQLTLAISKSLVLKTHGNHFIKTYGKLWLFILDPWHLFHNIVQAHGIYIRTYVHYLSYITTFIIFISKTHDNYSPYKHITIKKKLKKKKENITLFHYSGCYHILFETHGYFLYLKPMVNIILKKHWRSLFKSLPAPPPSQNIIYKIIHGKNYEKLYRLLFKAHGN